MSVTTLGALTFPSRRGTLTTIDQSLHITLSFQEKLHHLTQLTLHLSRYLKPSSIRHHGSSLTKYTAHVLPRSRLATHTILSSQSFNFHHRVCVPALRSPSSIGLSDYSDEQFKQRDKALFLRSFIIFTLKGYGHFPSASPICAAMWWKGWLWLAVASRGRAHVLST